MRVLVSILAGLGLTIGATGLAAPAFAITNPTCNNSSPSPESMFVGSTKTILVQAAGGCNQLEWINYSTDNAFFEVKLNGTAITSASAVSVSDGNQVTVTAKTGSETKTVNLTFKNTGVTPNQSTVIAFSVQSTPTPGPPSPSSSSTSSGPASVMQQFGLPASGNCEDGASDAMNWSGITSGAWGISWAQWMNNGAGGTVCTRTVEYDTSSAGWVVN